VSPVRISIITVCFNSASTIRDAIESVLGQDHQDIEYIIVDGASNDGTTEIIRSYGSRIDKWISEPDKGIYDAMNKGIAMATGDVIGMLNSDDFYFDQSVLSRIATTFTDTTIDAVFGDLIFVDAEDLQKTVRTYSSRNWHPGKFAWGFMPAHPTFFVRRKFYDKTGPFEIDYKIAADYEMLIRMLFVNKARYQYLGFNMVKMRRGGVSSRGWRSNVVLNSEIIRACRKNGIPTNAIKVYSKYFIKIFELLGK
jgi:glycosyltransferase involved in cell wall biosynthesis